MKVLKSLALAAALAAGSASAQAATYVAYDDFQLVGGAVQTGDFAVGYFSGAFDGSITAFSAVQASCGDAGVFCARTGESSVSKAYAGTYDPAGSHFWEAGFLNMHPGTEGEITVLQFVAPSDGVYNFAGSYTVHDTSPTGVSIGGYVGATSQFGETLEHGSRPFDFDAALAAGERVSFVLGAAGNYTYDSTGIALTVTSGGGLGAGGVPEPATWGMMLIGFGGLGAVLRNRRVRGSLGPA